MQTRYTKLLLATFTLLIALLTLFQQTRKASSQSAESSATGLPPTRSQKSLTKVVDYQPPADLRQESLQVRTVEPGETLASVNGEPIFLRDLIPIEDPADMTCRELSEDVFIYLLERAVTRELVVQEARKSGITLGAEEQQRLADQREQRLHGGPGHLRSLNVSQASIDFELQDAEAFMLQTKLLASRGSSPHVTSAQALDYFERHAGDFDPLPEEPAARELAWQELEVIIRNRLAGEVRRAFDRSLEVRMDDLKAAANIEVFAGPAE